MQNSATADTHTLQVANAYRYMAADHANGYHYRKHPGCHDCGNPQVVTFYVRRVRTRDITIQHRLRGDASMVGRVRYSREYNSLDEAFDEGNAWADTGDWSATIHYGTAPCDAHGKPTDPKELAHG